MLECKGSRQVTRARLPAKFATINWAAFCILFSSPSIAKSFVTMALDVMQAMDTLLSTTG
eukprot:752274-Lingulodinium_polyedra.AAC.1